MENSMYTGFPIMALASFLLFLAIATKVLIFSFALLPEKARGVIGKGLFYLIVLLLVICYLLFSLYWIPYTFYPDQLNTLIEYIKGLN